MPVTNHQKTKMNNKFSRTALLIGNDGMEKLSKAHVIVFGIGGVGGYVVEALVRSGVSHITIVDNDVVSETNINRQIIATTNTIGLDKVDVMKERILSINPEVEVETRKCFYLPETANQFDFKTYDYIVDCIDTVSAKLSIIIEAKKNDVPVISAMGAGNKMSPSMLEVSDISKTSVDPLAKVIRTELRKRGINHLKVVYSQEEPIKIDSDNPNFELKEKSQRPAPGSNAFVPNAMGLIMASEIINDLIK